MAEKLLHNAQVGTVLQKVRRKAVPQRVRVQPAHPHHAPRTLHNRMHGLPRNATAPLVEKDCLRGGAPHQPRAPLLEVLPHHARSRAHDGHHALLRPLAKDAHDLLVQPHVTQVEPAELGDAQATSVERLHDGAVALACGGLGERLVEKGLGLLHAQHVGQPRGLGGQRQVGRGEVLAYLVRNHKAVEALDGRDRTLDGGRRKPHVHQGGDVGLYRLTRDVVGAGDALLRKRRQVTRKVAAIGRDRIG